MEWHPVTSLFPMLSAEELTVLADDIRANGLEVPITVWQGKILDGRGRWQACALAGVAPRIVEWSGAGSPELWVIRKNLFRRHLTSGQRAAIAVEAQERFAQQTIDYGTQTEGIDALSPFTKTIHVSEVEEARRIKNQSPALFEDVLRGATTVASATSTLYWRQREQAEAARAVRRTSDQDRGMGQARDRAKSEGEQADTSLYERAMAENEITSRLAIEQAMRAVRSAVSALGEIRDARATRDPSVVSTALRTTESTEGVTSLAASVGEAAFYLACIAQDLGFTPENPADKPIDRGGSPSDGK